MKQIFQNLRTGQLEIADVPSPQAGPGQLLIQTRCSLISSGTERMLVSFAQSGLLGKALQQPEKVREVIDKIKTDGLLDTIQKVFARLDEPLPLGYCNCGVVLETGAGVTGFKIGDRVISNGGHAELVCVPKHLCAKVPDSVSDEEAAFTVLASIGLQGIRLLEPTFGETIVVFGLGLIGLMTVQLLKGCGCRVIGIDLDKNKLELARRFGAETVEVPDGADVVATAKAYTQGRGVDGVLITASAKEDVIVRQSAQMCRKRGRIVLVGVVNLELNRADFYEKELSFQVSCSYGPGRYDAAYEDKGMDYPYGFVRWTEQRNFEAILNAMEGGVLAVRDMIGKRIPQGEAQTAYSILSEQSDTMALVLTYPTEPIERVATLKVSSPRRHTAGSSRVVAGLIGAGNFAKLMLLPSLKGLNVKLKTVADINGAAGAYAGRKFGFETVTNDYKKIIEDDVINTVFITTRHDLHAPMVIEALKAGKHVHVEKPLALTAEQLEQIVEICGETSGMLHVGFNRRFSPHAEKIRSLLRARTSPMTLSWTINAGFIPPEVWLHDKGVGGGRIIGEGCHWLDLMCYLTDSDITHVTALQIGGDAAATPDDKISITVRLADGSVGTLHYFANGHKSYPKERLEVFCDGKILSLDNFRKLRGYGWSNFKKMNLLGQDKGHRTQFKRLIERIAEGGEPLISLERIVNVTQASFAAVQAAAEKQTIKVNG